jgi:hypothetical protein
VATSQGASSRERGSPSTAECAATISPVHLVLVPLRRSSLALAALLARMHHGRLNAYLGYVLLVLLAGLLLAQ